MRIVLSINRATFTSLSKQLHRRHQKPKKNHYYLWKKNRKLTNLQTTKQWKIKQFGKDGLPQYIETGNQNIRTNILQKSWTLSDIECERRRANMPIRWQKWQKLRHPCKYNSKFSISFIFPSNLYEFLHIFFYSVDFTSIIVLITSHSLLLPFWMLLNFSIILSAVSTCFPLLNQWPKLQPHVYQIASFNKVFLTSFFFSIDFNCDRFAWIYREMVYGGGEKSVPESVHIIIQCAENTTLLLLTFFL